MRKNSSDESPTVYEKIVPYNERKEIVSEKNITEYVLGPTSTVPKNLQKKLLSSKNFELCVVGITSSGDLRGWQNSQCRILENFNLSNDSAKFSPVLFIYLSFLVAFFNAKT